MHMEERRGPEQAQRLERVWLHAAAIMPLHAVQAHVHWERRRCNEEPKALKHAKGDNLENQPRFKPRKPIIVSK